MNIYLSLFRNVKRGFISFYKHWTPLPLRKKKLIVTHQQTVKKKNVKVCDYAVKLFQIDKMQ